MKLAVMGAGYVGLVAGACYSDSGNTVILVEKDPDRLRALAAGRIPIYEPGLEELVRLNETEGRLSFTDDIHTALAEAEVVCLAVGTPARADGTVDMTAMDQAVAQLAQAMRQPVVIMTKSTVPVGTCHRLSQMISSITSVPFDYVANPEFLKEGSAVNDFMKPDRVIVGLTSERALRVVRHLYAPFMRRSDRLLVMDPVSAELTKYACNAMLATRISFINEMAALCEQYGANIEHIRQGMGMDHRIGPDFLFPSLGYGGSCFPKDIQALIHMGRTMNCPMRLVEAVHAVNQEHRSRILRRIYEMFGEDLTGRTFAVWGLAFKARTDDVRESPALDIVRRLTASGARVVAHDPKAIPCAKVALGNINVQYQEDMYDVLRGADALIICTEWQEYRTPNFARIKSLLARPVILDGRNLYDLDWIQETGLTYFSLGRPVVSPSGQAGAEA